MAGRIEVAERVARQISRLDPPDAARISAYLRDPPAPFDDPREAGALSHGSGPGGYRRYRVGDYRILCALRDDELLVLAIEMGHRRSIYRRG